MADSLRTISDTDLMVKVGHLMERRAETLRAVEEAYGKGHAGPELALSEGFLMIIRKLLDGRGFVGLDFAASALRSALLANVPPAAAKDKPADE